MIKKTLLTSILFIIYFLGYGQWIQTDGPYGSSNALTVFEHKGSLFASGASCGFFSKSDADQPWTHVSNIYFKTHTLKGDSLFVTLLGGSGNKRGIQLFDLQHPEAEPVTVDAYLSPQALSHSDTALYCGDEYLGFITLKYNDSVHYYFNQGLPVDSIWNPWGGEYFYQINVTAIEQTDRYLFCGTKYGVFRSDSTMIWSKVNNGLPDEKVFLIKAMNDTLYTAIGSNLYYSSDYGNLWRLIFTDTTHITDFQKQNKRILIGTAEKGIYQSTDNGSTWNTMNTGLTDLQINGVIQHDSTILCATKTNGVFLYYNGTWLNNNKGMICSGINSIAVSNNRLFANDYLKVYRLNATNTWSEITPAVTYDHFGSLKAMNDTLFLSVEHDTTSWPYDIPFILYSPDQGTTWNKLNNQPPFARDDPYRLFCDDGRLFVYEDDIMYATNDLGTTWTNLSLPSQYCNNFNDVAMFHSQPFATACGTGELLKWDDFQNWTLSNNGLPLTGVPQKIVVCDSALFVQMNPGGIFSSFDNGAHWAYASNGLNAEWKIRDFAPYGRHLFVATNHGIFVTSNYGQYWSACNEGLKNTNTGAIKISNDTLYAGTYGDGIWKRAIEEINLSVPEQHPMASWFEVFPNPASDFLSLKTASERKGKIKLYDSMGRLILWQSVTTEKKIDLRDVPSGTYILVFQSNSQIITRKLIINR